VGVEEVVERWRIDDEWWRKEISRMYHRVLLVDGRLMTVFQDLVEGHWYLQAVASARRKAEPVDALVPRTAVTATVASDLQAPPRPIRRGVA
jgi:hypothetical protein